MKTVILSFKTPLLPARLPIRPFTLHPAFVLPFRPSVRVRPPVRPASALPPVRPTARAGAGRTYMHNTPDRPLWAAVTRTSMKNPVIFCPIPKHVLLNIFPSQKQGVWPEMGPYGPGSVGLTLELERAI